MTQQAVEWWQAKNTKEDLNDVCSHLREAERARENVGKCRSLFDALNTLWGAHRRFRHALNDSDSCSIKSLLLDGIPPMRTARLGENSATRSFASMRDPILNHDVLRRSPNYHPNGAIDEEPGKKASEEYLKLSRAFRCWERDKTADNQAALLEKLASVLYIVRSNIAHGEKTPQGPDLLKTERDKQVCSLCVPVLELLFDVAFNFPSKILATYGTLAPGQSNNFVLSDVHGEWTRGYVKGTAAELTNGLRGFIWNTAGDDIKVSMLHSHQLPMSWSRIDQFEGSAYTRILIPIKVRNSHYVVANVYEYVLL